MVHPGRAMLNRDAMLDGLPLPHRSYPSRAAGSFSGHVRSYQNKGAGCRSWHQAAPRTGLPYPSQGNFISVT